jgi:hypothetical protein
MSKPGAAETFSKPLPPTRKVVAPVNTPAGPTAMGPTLTVEGAVVAANTVEGEQALAGFVETIAANGAGDNCASRIGDVDRTLGGIGNPHHWPGKLDGIGATDGKITIDQHSIGHCVSA